MTENDISASGSVWSHQEKSSKDLAVMTLAAGLLIFIAFLFLPTNTETVLGALFLVVLVTLIVFLAMTKTTNIEIDRDKGAVRRTAQYLVFALRKSYPLQEFDSVMVSAEDEPAEDGYRTLRYSVVLSGRIRSLKLLSVDTEAEGKTIQKKLSDFLGLPAHDSPSSRRDQ